MFGISFFEIIIVLLVLLLVVGPKDIPKLMTKLGNIFGTAKKTSDNLRKEFYNSVYEPAKDFQNKVKAELTTIRTDSEKIIDEVKEDLKTIDQNSTIKKS